MDSVRDSRAREEPAGSNRSHNTPCASQATCYRTMHHQLRANRRTSIWHVRPRASCAEKPLAWQCCACVLHFLSDARSSNYGWVPLGVLPMERVASARGQMSGVWRSLLRHIFLRPGCNLAEGVALKNWHGALKHVTAGIKLLIQDEQALRQSLSTKGASGSVPCLYCRNIYSGRSDAPRRINNGIFHYVTALPRDFILATDASVWEAADLLSAQKPVMSDVAFADLEQSLGGKRSNMPPATCHDPPPSRRGLRNLALSMAYCAQIARKASFRSGCGTFALQGWCSTPAASWRTPLSGATCARYRTACWTGCTYYAAVAGRTSI